jgi:hypothetical protein
MIIYDQQILKEMVVAYLKAPIPEFIWRDWVKQHKDRVGIKPVMIQIGYLTNTSLQYHCYTILLGENTGKYLTYIIIIQIMNFL